MKIQVTCYSGRKSNERPIRFQCGNRQYQVEKIEDQWYGPDDVFYKVLADDGILYILRYNGGRDDWSLESFRKRQ